MVHVSFNSNMKRLHSVFAPSSQEEMVPQNISANQYKSVQISAVPASAEQGGDLVLPCLRKHVRQAVQQRKRRVVVPGVTCLNKPPPTAEACKMQNTTFFFLSDK